MPKTDNFIDNFQADHVELLKLIASFRKEIESSNPNKAKVILDRIENRTNGHFEFEETYLYPRLRRLMLEITTRLHKDQQTIREFIDNSRSILNTDRCIAKDELTNLLDMLPKLNRFFKDCDDLAFLAEKFDTEDKEDLNLRFKQCLEKKSAVCV